MTSQNELATRGSGGSGLLPVAFALGACGFHPNEGTYEVEDVLVYAACDSPAEPENPFGDYQIIEGNDFGISDARRRSFSLAYTSCPTEDCPELQVSCDIGEEAEYTFECEPYLNDLGYTWTLSGVWISESELQGRLNYAPCPSSYCDIQCEVDWFFSAER